MKASLLLLLALSGIVCTNDHPKEDASDIVSIDLAPGHDALYFSPAAEKPFIAWDAPAQSLIPFPLELLYIDYKALTMPEDLLDSAEAMLHISELILSNLNQLSGHSPAILRMDSNSIRNIVASH